MANDWKLAEDFKNHHNRISDLGNRFSGRWKRLLSRPLKAPP
jgi:hypothetical protein